MHTKRLKTKFILGGALFTTLAILAGSWLHNVIMAFGIVAPWDFLFTLPFFLLIMLVPLWLALERWIFRPLGRISYSNIQVAQGNLEAATIPDGVFQKDEMGAAIYSHNVMLDLLLDHQRQSQELNATFEERVRQRTFELQFLYELSQQIGYTLDYEELFNLIHTSLHQVMNFELGASLVVDVSAAGRHESSLTYYLPQPVAPALKEAAKENLLAAFKVMSGDSPQHLRTVELLGATYNADQPSIKEVLRSFFNVPLIMDGKTIGLLHVASRKPEAFDGSQIRLLYTVAANASDAVKRLQALLAREKAYLEAVVAGLREGVVLLDRQERVLLANPAVATILRQLGLGNAQPEISLPSLGALTVNKIRSQVDNSQGSLAQLAILGEEPGPFVQLWGASLEVFGSSSLLLVLRDITEEHCHEEALRHLSTTDSLTGLFNRRRLFEVLEAEIARAQRYGIPLSLIILDLDKLKHINDTYGHPSGDEALRQVAWVIRQQSRKTDLPARYGGDEFVLLMPHTSAKQAERVAQRLLTSVSQVQLDSSCEGLSISIGIAMLEAEDERGDGLLARADQALYQAKQAGRRCVVMLTQI